MDMEVIKIKVDEHEKKIDEHEKRLAAIEQDGIELKTELKNLCESINNLMSIMKWFIGIWVTSLLGFFFYVIQYIIFK
jgi:peptidoglycan hydrolase CwlO-like protein